MSNIKSPLRNFVAISLSYCSLTLTDGALRTIILLHCSSLGFIPLEIAAMFMLYEFAGIGTNLLGGILATQRGLKYTGILGLLLMAISVVLVAPVQSMFGTGEPSSVVNNNNNNNNNNMNPNINTNSSTLNATVTTDDNLLAGSLQSQAMASVRLHYMIYIFFVQGLAGIGKDLMKISGKSITKLVNKKGDNGALFKMVAYVTGAKNTVKGIGTFLGGVVLLLGYWQGCIILALFVIVPIPFMFIYVDDNLAISKKVIKIQDIFMNISYNVRLLSMARFWLFGSRDVWFEIAFPIFLKKILRWPNSAVSAAMGFYIIMYGGLQGYSPRLCLKPMGCQPPQSKHVAPWTFVLGLLCLIFGCIYYGVHGIESLSLSMEIQQDRHLWWTLSIITPIISIIFAIVMAVLSSMHSYLIVLYAGRKKVAKDVGFYYMSNAGGRFVGTLVSGLLCEYTGDSWGLIIPLWVSCMFLFISCCTSSLLKIHVPEDEQHDGSDDKNGDKKDEKNDEKNEKKTIDTHKETEMEEVHVVL